MRSLMVSIVILSKLEQSSRVQWRNIPAHSQQDLHDVVELGVRHHWQYLLFECCLNILVVLFAHGRAREGEMGDRQTDTEREIYVPATATALKNRSSPAQRSGVMLLRISAFATAATRSFTQASFCSINL